MFFCLCLPPPPTHTHQDLLLLKLFFNKSNAFSRLPQPVNITWASLTKHECEKFGGQLVGEVCDFVPDITLMSFILFFGTYTCSMGLKTFKTSRFFPTTVSNGPLLSQRISSVPADRNTG